MTTQTTAVIPCYNEARRLDTGAITSLLDEDRLDLMLVDDGSTDATLTVLNDLARTRPDRIRVLALERNQGKAEAVRRGLLAAIATGRARFVGYFDADLATPASEVRRLVRIMQRGDADVLFGARVALLGHAIERRPVRHYLGRVFATLASMALRLTTYDTQCGAKLFRITPTLEGVLREPFLSRWAFDIELLGRLLAGSDEVPPIDPSGVWEEPLLAWRDVKGSKLDARQMARALTDLARIDRDLARRRSRAAGRPLAPRAVAVLDDVELARAHH